jgi:anti-sigma regulatory factor (Ser/Thr protein kinase)
MITADGQRRQEPESLIHPALFYHDEQSYLADTVPYIHEGIDAGEPVMVAVPPGNLELLRNALGTDSRSVEFHDMTVMGRNPARIIATVLCAFADKHRDAGRVRIIGEPIWAGRTDDEYPACVQHEALINVALRDSAATVLCPYDTATLAPHVLADARQTHPVIVEYGDWTRSEAYAEPVTLAATFNRRLPEPPRARGTLKFEARGSTQTIRGFVARRALDLGLEPPRVSDLCAAVHEVALNTMIHTSGPGILSIWSTRDCGGNTSVVVEIHDGGWIADPLVGRRARGDGDRRGYGLSLVNKLCDLVLIHTDPAEGTTVRMTMLMDERSPLS